MNINKVDVIWNYIATFLKIASSVILLPLILKYLPRQEVGIWSIFSSITALVFLLDFGFHSTFARNVSYVFSGAQFLEKEGVKIGVNNDTCINYNLLKDIISAMKWFYTRIALVLLFILLFIGTPYFNYILKGYDGTKLHLQIAWILFCLISTYNMYTLYYDALLEGKGLVKLSKQISIIGNISYLMVAALLILFGFGLIAIIISQLFSIVIIRVLAHNFFFTKQLLFKLNNIKVTSDNNVLKIITPNAIKYGVTSLGGFMIQKSSIFIGSLFIPLISIASFGITKQLIEILVAVANITLATYIPKISQLRVKNDVKSLKSIYIKGILISNFIYIFGSLIIFIFGNWVLRLLNCSTNLVSADVMIVMIISSLIGLNAGISGSVISTKNVIPFMKPSIYSGIASIVLLFIIFNYSNFGLLGMAAVPGIVDLFYQGWKWPYEVIKDFNITLKDVKISINELFNLSIKK